MRKGNVEAVENSIQPAAVMRPLTDPLGTTDVALDYYELEPGDSFAFAYTTTRSRRRCSPTDPHQPSPAAFHQSARRPTILVPTATELLTPDTAARWSSSPPAC